MTGSRRQTDPNQTRIIHRKTELPPSCRSYVSDPRGGRAILRLFVIAAVLIAMAAGVAFAPSVSAAPPVKKVLIIFPTSQAYEFYVLFTDGFKARLQEETSWRTEYYYESIDILNLGDNDFLAPTVAEVLRRKYEHDRPDLILTQNNYAANFLRQYCSDVFGDTPTIVFYARPSVINTDASPANYTFYFPKLDPARSVELIMAIQPSIRQIYVVVGSSTQERKVREELPQQLASFAGQVEITYLTQLPFEEVNARIRAIEGPAAILIVDFRSDSTGKLFDSSQVIRRLTTEARVPVFVSYSIHLERGGAVGGHVLNMKLFGREVGNKAIDILTGRAEPKKVQALDTAEYQFDWNELKRWGIAEDRLPPGSVILNKPPSLWETYKWHIIIMALAVVLLVMLLEAGVIALYWRNKRKTEAELLRLDRLNLVGEMAASIGHEVRNPMTTVRGYLQWMQTKEKYADNYEQFETMIGELDRANSIIGDFLSLAKNKLVEFKQGNLNNIITTLIPLLQADALRSDHDLVTDLGNVPDIHLDEKEIRQVVLNLVRNGFEAMKPGGRLTIMTYEDKGKVVLGVHDIGPGIPAKVLKKLGTPFTTTKENGTGLGLPVCYRIAERHGAKIDVKTSPEGTTFIISFPIDNVQ